MRKIVKFVWHLMPVSVRRLLHSIAYNKEKFLLKNASDVFTDVYKSHYWKSSESVSGGGSDVAATVTIREQIPIVVAKFAIRSMLDVPCGDYNWMRTVPKDCDYIGGDIVAEVAASNQKLYGSDKVRFCRIDITKDVLPKVDLIFCKDCLQHLSYQNVAKALVNFKNSGAKYLWVTSYPKTWRNHNIYDGDYRSLNLTKKPFCLPRPILKVREKSKATYVEVDKMMYLYEIQSLPARYEV